MPDRSTETDNRTDENAGAKVFGDQRAALLEVGVEMKPHASLRPLMTIGDGSRKVVIVLLTKPDEGPAIDELAPWLEASSNLIEHMEGRPS